MSYFSDKLKACYEAKYFDRTNFAKEIGLNESTIRNWIRNDNLPSADVLYKIAKFFGVPMEYFIDGGDSNFSDREIVLLLRMKTLTDEQIKTISLLIDTLHEENCKTEKKQ